MFFENAFYQNLNQKIKRIFLGSFFGADFETVCRRMVKLMWHCCGHLFIKHWEQLAMLNIHLQFSLVLAHLSKVVKFYSILDAKENLSLQNTLQKIRPKKFIAHRSLSPKTQKTPLSNNNNGNALIQRPNKKRSNADMANELQRLQKQANTTGGGSRWPIKCHPQPSDSNQSTTQRFAFPGKWSSWGGAINRTNEPNNDNNTKENVETALTVSDLLNNGNCKCYAQTC